jgi:hypothetical protein
MNEIFNEHRRSFFISWNLTDKIKAAATNNKKKKKRNNSRPTYCTSRIRNLQVPGIVDNNSYPRHWPVKEQPPMIYGVLAVDGTTSHIHTNQEVRTFVQSRCERCEHICTTEHGICNDKK